MQAEPSSFGQGLDRAAKALPGAEPNDALPSQALLSQATLNQVPLFHAAWLFAAGIALTRWLYLRPSFVLIAALCAMSLAALAAFRMQRIAWLPLALTWLLLGAWCALMEPQPAPDPHLSALSDGLLRTVEGTVTAAGPVDKFEPDTQ